MPTITMDEENDEWPEPSVPLYFYPRVVISALIGGSVIQYIWLQYALPIVGFYNILDNKLSDMADSVFRLVELVVATVTSRPESNSIEILVEAALTSTTTLFFMVALILPIFLLGSMLAYSLDPNSSRKPGI